jgi:hypothetical protein
MLQSLIDNLRRGRWLQACLTLGLAASAAHANLVTSIPGGTVITMPSLNYFGPGPQAFGSGITWTSTNASNQGGSVFGYTGGYGFAGNGFWDGAVGPMAGLNDSTLTTGISDTMTFSFATPVEAVGGFLNYAPGYGTPTIAVYDPTNTLIESATLSFLTSGGADQGQFLGFQETTANIGSFTLTDAYVSITDLTVGGLNPVPEPAAFIPLAALLGVLAFGLVRRHRVRVQA